MGHTGASVALSFLPSPTHLLDRQPIPPFATGTGFPCPPLILFKVMSKAISEHITLDPEWDRQTRSKGKKYPNSFYLYLKVVTFPQTYKHRYPIFPQISLTLNHHILRVFRGRDEDLVTLTLKCLSVDIDYDTKINCRHFEFSECLVDYFQFLAFSFFFLTYLIFASFAPPKLYINSGKNILFAGTDD